MKIAKRLIGKIWRKNESGVALLLTLVAVLFMVFMAVEIGYNTMVELRVGSAQLDRLKAYYLAKSGVQVSLLRINAYKTVMQRFGQQLGAQKGQLDMVWQLPFSWPPIELPDMSDFDKKAIDDVVKKSYIEGSFQTQIEGESGKIDINDLGSPSDTVKKATYAVLTQLIQNRLNQDDDWAKDHVNVRPQEIVNAIADWVTPGDQSVGGGSKTSGYGNGDPPVNPPGRPMKTLAELHYVKGVTDDIYNLLAPKITVYGLKGINVNYCSSEVLQSLDQRITKEIADKAIERRTDPRLGGPFKDAQDFTGFLQQQGMNVQNFNQNPEIPLFFDQEYNFRIKSTGISGKAQREILAIVYDFDKVKSQLVQFLSASTSPSAGQGGTTPTPTAGTAPSATAGGGGTTNAGGPPTIVFWQEF